LEVSTRELGSPELPTMGSAGHELGTCKPCAFLYSKGCAKGVHCMFCHRCGPGEKKRRQKEKSEARRTLQQWQLSQVSDMELLDWRKCAKGLWQSC